MAADVTALDTPDRSSSPPIEWGLTSALTASDRERRLEGSSYLADGYGRRLAIEARGSGWRRLSEYAKVTQPGRLKGIEISEADGVPYLSPGQIFEARPRPRRFLSLAGTLGAEECLVSKGTLLVTRSGSVGRITIAHSPHIGVVISDDLLRVVASKEEVSGWLYCYLRSDFVRSMAIAANYGHSVKHLDPSHLAEIPVIDITLSQHRRFSTDVRSIFDLRSEAHTLVDRAENLYAEALHWRDESYNEYYVVASHSLFAQRRRLDAFHYNRRAVSIADSIYRHARSVSTLGVTCGAMVLPTRFTRFFGENGIPYRSAEELFDLNPPVTKRIYSGLVGNAEVYMLKSGWLLMACSGQLYGLNGSVMLLNDSHSGIFGTHDMIRIDPGDNIRAGFLLVVLSHPTLGRPLVVAHGYGTSVPHLDPIDIKRIPVPRFASSIEDSIADLMDEAAAKRATADLLENELGEEANSIIAGFLRSHSN